ncbi:hypothetical protein POPTR_019G108050v4 [Populus trichocarpa]|uniref:Uncharacterized protein n=1 Tax=Populus trichocarpa TaxID=3694 RepID=A0ACC0RKI9_POPTR|nr:hypothetical protein POPTR_019G108050v4 [Populus trichocarpa]
MGGGGAGAQETIDTGTTQGKHWREDELRGGNNTGGAYNRDEQRKPGEKKEDRGSEGNTDRPEEKITDQRRKSQGTNRQKDEEEEAQNRRRENRTNNTRIPGDKYRERTGDPRK